MTTHRSNRLALAVVAAICVLLAGRLQFAFLANAGLNGVILGMTKAEVRAWSQRLGLPTWDKPQMACLASRLPYGTQVTVGGTVERLSAAETLRYFVTRRRDRQIAAWASRQSAPLPSRQVLEMEWQALRRKFAAGEVPLPDFWGGFRVVPETAEFWQGGPNRLHDRLLYVKGADGAWTRERLAP